MNIYENDDLEVLCATAEQVWQKQMEKDQQNQNEDTWGMFSYGDAPPAIGGGMGVFCWFDSRDELLDFIVKTLPFCPPGPGSDNPIETAKLVNVITIPSPKFKLILHEFCRFLRLGRYDHQLKMYHHFCPVH
jgi:hypothetical protein